MIVVEWKLVKFFSHGATVEPNRASGRVQPRLLTQKRSEFLRHYSKKKHFALVRLLVTIFKMFAKIITVSEFLGTIIALLHRRNRIVSQYKWLIVDKSWFSVSLTRETSKSADNRLYSLAMQLWSTLNGVYFGTNDKLGTYELRVEHCNTANKNMHRNVFPHRSDKVVLSYIGSIKLTQLLTLKFMHKIQITVLPHVWFHDIKFISASLTLREGNLSLTSEFLS